MKRETRVMESIYMQWAKTRANLPYNLATSGVFAYPLKELEITSDDLELSGPVYYGYEPLQQALALKCNVAVETVVAATGTSMANHLVMAAILAPGDEVLIEQPTYEPLLCGGEVSWRKRQTFCASVRERISCRARRNTQESGVNTKLIVMTNLHNPSGAMTDANTMKEIGGMARSCGAKVLVDEVYLETLFGAPAPNLHFTSTGICYCVQPHKSIRTQRLALRMDPG